MPRRVDAILNEGLALPPADRAELADRLLQSLHGLPPESGHLAKIDAAWSQVVQRRNREIEEGSVTPIGGDEILRRLRSGERPRTRPAPAT